MKIWDALGHAVTLNFDLLTPKSNQFISVPEVHQWRKFGENPSTDTGDIAETWNYHVSHGRTDARIAARTDNPKTYSLRRRLPAAEPPPAPTGGGGLKIV